MCTLALYYRSFDGYPLVVAANRDEHYDRPAAPPGLLGGNPAILAGRDLRAVGTWLGVNEHGLLAGILNRRSDGAPRPGARSRGLLCLDILAQKSAAQARAFVQAHRAVYQPFTLVVADQNEAWSGYNTADDIEAQPLGLGVHVFSNAGEADAIADKRDRAYGRFAALADELQRRGDADRFLGLQSVLKDHSLGDGSNDPRDAICMHGENAGTVSSSIILYAQRERCFQSYYCPGAPCRNNFSPMTELTVR